MAWLDDKGVIRVNRGFRFQYSSSLGPFVVSRKTEPNRAEPKPESSIADVAILEYDVRRMFSHSTVPQLVVSPPHTRTLLRLENLPPRKIITSRNLESLAPGERRRVVNLPHELSIALGSSICFRSVIDFPLKLLSSRLPDSKPFVDKTAETKRTNITTPIG